MADSPLHPSRDRRLPDWTEDGQPRAGHFQVRCEGQPVTAYPGESLAAALFAGGVAVLSRSPKFHRPRGPFCFTGGCNGCLMQVDGLPNIKACQVAVRPGLRCQRQNAWPSAGLDLLAGADLMFAEGMDHHTLLTAPRPLNELLHRVVRQLGGLGRLPDLSRLPQGPDALPAAEALHVDVIIVGAGPAGLAAAQALQGARRRVLLLEARARAGGSYLSHPDHGPRAAAEALGQLGDTELRCGTQVVGYYPEDQSPAAVGKGLLAAVSAEGRLLKLSAPHTVYATGGYEQNQLFPDNDRPGVLAARAVGLLLTSHGILAGRRPVVLGGGAYGQRLALALRAAGAEVTLVDSRERVRALVAGPLGDSLRGVTVEDERGRSRDLPCDALAVVAPPAPAAELPRQHGAAVDFQEQASGDFVGAGPGGFAVRVGGAEGDEAVGLAAPGVWACGDVTGTAGVAAAMAHGAAVGAALRRRLLQEGR